MDNTSIIFMMKISLAHVFSVLAPQTSADPKQSSASFRKFIDLKNLGLYWNTNAKSFANDVEEVLACHVEKVLA